MTVPTNVFTVLCLCWPLSFFGQFEPLHSVYGLCHTPRGQLHVLVIVVRYQDSDQMRGEPSWPDLSVPGELPAFLQGDDNDLFSKSFNPRLDKRNLTAFYHEMSGGVFTLTGEVYPVQVPVKYEPLRTGNFFSRQAVMNSEAVRWITENDPGFEWNRFDRRKNNPNYRFDNTGYQPDSILDYVVFIHRAGGGLTGMGAPGASEIPGSVFKIRNGHTGIQGYASAYHQWEYFNHEFAHNLFNAPHYLGANRANGNRFYTQKGWGLMHPGHAPFFTINAWEAWWLGWREPLWIVGDTTIRLPDFPLTGQSAAFRLPNDDILFFELHTGRSRWDAKLFFADPEKDQPQTGKGLYVYQVSPPGALREAPQLNPFDPRHSNFIRMYHGRGNHDYQFARDTARFEYLHMPVFSQGAPNPVSGQHPFQFIRADFNLDGKLPAPFSHGNSDGGGGEQHDIWAETSPKGARFTYAGTGDATAPFLPGDVAGLDGKAVITSYPVFDSRADSLAPYQMFAFRFGVDTLPDGSWLLRILTNDPVVRKPTRWAGNMQIGSFGIGPSGALLVNHSGIANRQSLDPITGTFARRTILRQSSGSRVVIQGKMELDNHSVWQAVLCEGIVVEKGGQLELGAGSVLELDAPQQLLLERGSKLILKPGARLQFSDQTYDKTNRARRALRASAPDQTSATQP